MLPRFSRKRSLTADVNLEDALHLMKEEDLTSMVVYSVSGNTAYLLDIKDIVTYLAHTENELSHLIPVDYLSGLYLDLVCEFNPNGYGDEDEPMFWEVREGDSLSTILDKQLYGSSQLFYLDDHDEKVNNSSNKTIGIKDTLRRIKDLRRPDIENATIGDVYASKIQKSLHACTRSDESVQSALKTLVYSKAEAIPVLDRNGRIIGSFSYDVLFPLVGSEGTWLDRLQVSTVEDVMQPVEAISTSTKIIDAIDQALQANQPNLWVCDRKKTPMALVNSLELLKPYRFSL